MRKHHTTIDTSNLVDKVERRLLEIFLKKKLKPGDPIPKVSRKAI